MRKLVFLFTFAYFSIFYSPYIVALTAGLTLLLAPFVFIQAATEEVMDRNILAKIMQSYGFTSAGAYMVFSGLTFALVLSSPICESYRNFVEHLHMDILYFHENKYWDLKTRSSFLVIFILKIADYAAFGGFSAAF